MNIKNKVILPLITVIALGFNLSTINQSMAESTNMTKSNVVQNINGDTQIDWSKNVIKVTGSGAPPDRGSAAQKRLMAIRAAKTDAFRQLLETTEGVHVNAETVVRDFVTESDVVKTQVQGLVKGAEQVGDVRYLSDGSVEIDLQIRIFGAESVASVIKPEQHPDNITPTKLEPTNVSQNYTSVIVDCRGLNVQPAMSPSILDAEGGEVYYGNLPVDPDFVINQGIVSYAASISEAKKNARAGNNPLIVKGTKVQGLFKSDVSISDSDAKKLIGANNTAQFLKSSKVIMLI
ncbi:MAG: hypothetical protein H7263_01945 [Candidatus Sericytochromatia bacterium]|nr:hypothetical protein [Candidatus Sericytochromatia bacterium]